MGRTYPKASAPEPEAQRGCPKTGQRSDDRPQTTDASPCRLEVKSVVCPSVVCGPTGCETASQSLGLLKRSRLEAGYISQPGGLRLGSRRLRASGGGTSFNRRTSSVPPLRSPRPIAAKLNVRDLQCGASAPQPRLVTLAGALPMMRH